MSKQEDVLRPGKPLEKTREIENQARIPKKSEMKKKKINKNQKRITLWDMLGKTNLSFESLIFPQRYYFAGKTYT